MGVKSGIPHNTRRIAQVNTPRIGKRAKPARMNIKTIMHQRLREARQKAGYKRAIDAIKAFGFKEGTFRHHDNGTRPFDMNDAIRYGRAFGVNPSWLLGIDKREEALATAENGRPLLLPVALPSEELLTDNFSILLAQIPEYRQIPAVEFAALLARHLRAVLSGATSASPLPLHDEPTPPEATPPEQSHPKRRPE